MGFFNNGGSSSGVTPEDLEKKVDKVTGKGLSTNDYTTAEKNKLNGIASGANNYIHPNDINTRHVTDTEKTTWNGKADKTLASTTVAGLVKKCATQADSTATTIEELLVDFNGLLAKMKNAGLM